MQFEMYVIKDSYCILQTLHQCHYERKSKTACGGMQN